MSTRSNGRIAKTQPLLAQFNYVLASVRIGNRYYVLDTSDKNCPYNMLPSEDLVEEGLIIDSRNGKFIRIPHPSSLNFAYCQTESKLDSAGNLTATSKLRYDGYRAFSVRKAIRESGEEDFVKDFVKENFEQARIDTFNVEGLDDVEHSLRIWIRYSVPKFAQVAGNMIYLSVPELDGLSSNPFQREKRFFPVEFPYKITSTDEVKVQLPPGYHVLEVPKPVSARFQKATFTAHWYGNDDKIIATRKFIRNQLIFSSLAYKSLRKFYDSVVAADQSKIVASSASDTQ